MSEGPQFGKHPTDHVYTMADAEEPPSQRPSHGWSSSIHPVPLFPRSKGDGEFPRSQEQEEEESRRTHILNTQLKEGAHENSSSSHA